MFDNSIKLRLQLERVASGDQVALAGLWEFYRPRLRRMVQLRLDRRIQGRIDPSDVLQEAFVDISKRASENSQKPEMPFFLWLRMMTGQKLLEIHRRHLSTQIRDAGREVSLCYGDPEVSSQLLASQLVETMTSVSNAAIHAERQSQLESLLNAMEPIDREILTLRHFEELSNSEVAQVLNLSKSAASNRYFRALKHLKDLLITLPEFMSER